MATTAYQPSSCILLTASAAVPPARWHGICRWPSIKHKITAYKVPLPPPHVHLVLMCSLICHHLCAPAAAVLWWVSLTHALSRALLARCRRNIARPQRCSSTAMLPLRAAVCATQTDVWGAVLCCAAAGLIKVPEQSVCISLPVCSVGPWRQCSAHCAAAHLNALNFCLYGCLACGFDFRARPACVQCSGNTRHVHVKEETVVAANVSM